MEGFTFQRSKHLANKRKNHNRVLFMVNSIRSRNQYINTLWNPGANISLIFHNVAKRLGLQGSDVDLTITKAGKMTDYIKSK